MMDFENIPPLHFDFHDPKEAMSTPRIWGVINKLAGMGSYYLEVGSWCGATLCAAASGNPGTFCVGIENYALAKKRGPEKVAWQRERLFENVLQYENTAIFENDYREVLETMAVDSFRVDCYFYDGPHEYEDQLQGLEMALPLLNPGAFILVDDANWQQVQDANREFQARHGWETVFRMLTDRNGHPEWWNGIEIMRKK